MFGTLHWNSHNKEAEFVERLHGSSNLEKNSACDRCRAKKVKCSINDNGCSRCKRLKKTCTFNSIKHRGDQRLRKESINIAQQEHSLDLLTQPSVSSSSKDIRHEEGVYSDKWPLASSLLSNSSVDDSEREQYLLVEPPTNRLADILPNFDLPFFHEFGQQTNEQGGDNIFNITTSPSPLFSTSFPGTHPEPIQPAAVRMSENLLSPSLSLGDEIPRYLPPTDLDFMTSIYDSPTRQSQDTSLFEIGSNATPTSSHASTLVSTAFSSQNSFGQSCQCLAAVIFAVEEFEASCNSGNRAELDSIIAYKKEAINCCRSMFKCSNCMTKRENCVLLVFMTEKIVAACGQIIVLYRMKDGNTQAGSVQSSLPGCLPPDCLSNQHNAISASSSSSKTDCTHSGSIMSTGMGTSSDWRELLLGDYEISSPLEWEHLVRVLIFLQFRAVKELLTDMKNMGSKVLGETQTASLVQAEIRVGELEKSIYIE